MQIELLRKKPATFMEAVDFLRDLEEIFGKVRGPNSAEKRDELESPRTDMEVIEQSEIVSRKINPEADVYLEQMAKLMQRMKTLVGKVDKEVSGTEKEGKKIERVALAGGYGSGGR